MRPMVTTLVLLFVVSLIFPASVGADDAEKIAMARVRLTTESGGLAGCFRVGVVTDGSVKDLRKKIVRAGGDTGVLTFGSDDMSNIHAEVFRCPVTPDGKR